MTPIETLLKELDQEAITTRKMLERVPSDRFDWQPHPKSMSIQRLSTHLAELPGWISMVIATDGLDFAANPYGPMVVNDSGELLDYFERTLAEGRRDLKNSSAAELEESWTLRNGDHILQAGSKADFIRITYSQIVHHRAQLGVFLRMLDIPIPGSYGPSADEMSGDYAC